MTRRSLVALAFAVGAAFGAMVTWYVTRPEPLPQAGARISAAEKLRRICRNGYTLLSGDILDPHHAVIVATTIDLCAGSEERARAVDRPEHDPFDERAMIDAMRQELRSWLEAFRPIATARRLNEYGEPVE